MASSHSVTGGLRSLRDLTQHLTARADDSHAPPVSAFPKAPLSFKRIRGMSSPGGILNALATALHGSIRTAPSIHRLRLGLLGYLIPFAPLAFVSQCQCRPSRVLSPLVFFPISTHFTAPPEIPSAPTESGPCLSPSVADHPLGPATDHRLGKLLPHQLANQTRAPPRADSSFCSSAYGVLAAVSSCCSPPKGRFLRVTHPSATGNTTSRPTCMCKACRQRSS
ncbi:hypothetical protein JHK87_055575 [Glycine soja]|nr:hypothetical protein JHK87_055575 [Glycine soja]